MLEVPPNIGGRHMGGYLCYPVFVASFTETSRCFLRCWQVSSSSSRLFNMVFWFAVKITNFSVKHRSQALLPLENACPLAFIDHVTSKWILSSFNFNIWQKCCVHGWPFVEWRFMLTESRFKVNRWTKVWHNLIISLYVCLVNNICLFAVPWDRTINLVSTVTSKTFFFLLSFLFFAICLVLYQYFSYFNDWPWLLNMFKN